MFISKINFIFDYFVILSQTVKNSKIFVKISRTSFLESTSVAIVLVKLFWTNVTRKEFFTNRS